MESVTLGNNLKAVLWLAVNEALTNTLQVL